MSVSKAIKWFTLLLLANANLVISETLTIQTKLGPVQGSVVDVLNRPHHRFLGIPYAQSPVGNLRFEPPQSVVGWKETKVCVDFQASCPQIIDKYPFNDRLDPTSSEGKQSEDCLYLNIYTPRVGQEAKLPVFFYIHEGAFEFGSGATWQGQILSQHQQVVVVTINYRLASFGFLTGIDEKSGDTIIEPNLGFLDQVAAMKWVHENIDDYGGDPNQVTIGGNSAGAVAVGYHILVASSHPYFTRSILMSGVANLPGSYLTDYTHANSVLKHILKELNCSSEEKDGIRACLNAASTDEIIEAQRAMMKQIILPFVIILNKTLIDDDPNNVIKNGQFKKDNVMIGTVEADGQFFIIDFEPLIKDAGIDENLYNDAVDLAFTEMSNTALHAVKFYYKDHYNPDNQQLYLNNLINALTDWLFIAPAAYCADHFTNHSVTTYKYHFNFRTQKSGYFKDYHGVAHTMELPYVFGYPLDKPYYVKDQYSPEDVKVSEMIMDAWGNFIKTGKPTFDQHQQPWLPYDMATQSYYYIGERVEMRQRLRANAVAFWNQYIPKLLENMKHEAKGPTIGIIDEEYMEDIVYYPEEEDNSTTPQLIPGQQPSQKDEL